MSVTATFAVPAEAMVLSESVEANPGLRFELERAVPFGDAGRNVWVSGEGHATALDAATVAGMPDRTLVRAEGAAPFLSLVGERTAVVSATTGDGGWLVRLRFPDGPAVAGLYRACLDAGVPVTLRRSDTGRSDGVEPTPAGAKTLRLAVERGYFAVPRETSVGALAAELGVSEGTVSKRLKRGSGAVLAGMTAGAREERA